MTVFWSIMVPLLAVVLTGVYFVCNRTPGVYRGPTGRALIALACAGCQQQKRGLRRGEGIAMHSAACLRSTS